MGKGVKSKGGVGKAKARTRPYPYEFRIKMVRLYLEEGYSTTVLREQFGVSSHSVNRWAKAYREQGTEGLVVKLGTKTKPRMTEEVKGRILGVKKKHPEYGPRRIADVLKRFFLVSASPTRKKRLRTSAIQRIRPNRGFLKDRVRTSCGKATS